MPDNEGLTSFAENPTRSVERDVLVEGQYTRPDQIEKTSVKPARWPWCRSKDDGKWLPRLIAAVLCFALALVLFILFLAYVFTRPAAIPVRQEPQLVYTLPTESSHRNQNTAHAKVLVPEQFFDEFTTTPLTITTTDNTETTTITTESESESTTTFAPTTEISTSTSSFEFFDAIDGEKSETCLERMALGSPSGVYQVKVGKTFEAYCDMDTSNGGWTVVQRRMDRDGSFHKRTMKEYIEGFGNLKGNYWLGLEKLHLLAPVGSVPANLRIELEGETCDSTCTKRFAYSWAGEWNVQFGGPKEGYKIVLGKMHSGNLTFNDIDPFFEGSNGARFSASDYDQDGNDFINCAQFRMLGPWWHGKKCSDIGLNGYYQTISEKYDTSDRNQNAKRYFVWGFDKQVWNGYPYTIHIRRSTMLLKSQSESS